MADGPDLFQVGLCDPVKLKIGHHLHCAHFASQLVDDLLAVPKSAVVDLLACW
jgi:hypothetical protein